MKHEPVTREMEDAEWSSFKYKLKEAFASIKIIMKELRYQRNISKAQLLSNSMNQAWKEVM
jgi:hypothetical protein